MIINESVGNGSEELRVARQYHQRGWSVTPVHDRDKSPKLSGWQNRQLSEDELPAHFCDGANVGVVLGDPSGNLVDVDLDCQAARQLAPHLLDATACFGRASSPRSHWLYLVRDGIKTKKFQSAAKGMIVELRSTGAQTVFPGSTHPSGERIEWSDDREVAEVSAESLLEQVVDVAIAALLLENWPVKGSRHEASLALAGGFARGGVPLERTTRIMAAVAKESGCDDLTTKIKNMEGTYQKVKNDAESTGWPRLAELLGDDPVRTIRKWLGVGDSVGVIAGIPDQNARLCTDIGNAARLVRQHGHQLRWCSGHGQWYVWGGTHWTTDDREQVLAAAKEAALCILDEAKAEEASEERRQELIKHASRSQNKERLKAMVELAKPELAIVPGEFDGDPWLFNCANGTLDLQTGKLREHQSIDLLTKLSSVTYDEEAQAPTWDGFIHRIFDGNVELVGYVQRLLGHMLTGDVSEQILPVFWGQGANGKSTLLDAVVHVLGDYADSAAPDLLMQRSNDEHPTELADLMGKRLVVASESERNRKLKIQLVKRLTGDENIKARFMRQDYFTFRRQFKLILVTNNKPRVDEDSEAVWRRLRLIPFNVVIPERERDSRLLEKLKGESSGILRWLIEGCLAWRREGLGEPELVRSVTSEYRKESNPVELFFEEYCEFHDEAWVSSRDLLDAYHQWCDEVCEGVISDREFYESIRRRGCSDGRKNKGQTRGWKGIRLVGQARYSAGVGQILPTRNGSA